MNKDNLNSNDDWKGLLTSQFEDDIQVPPNKQWDAIQNELFPKKKRRFFVRWISMLILLLGERELFLFKNQLIRIRKLMHNIKSLREKLNLILWKKDHGVILSQRSIQVKIIKKKSSANEN